MFGKKDDKAVAIIPARLGSTRFPRKALADDTGKPMVVHVCEQAAKAESVSRVVVATDSEEIKSAVEAHGFDAVMTSVEHTNGTSRLAEAASVLKLRPRDIVINVQGDEPEVDTEVINGAYCAVGAVVKQGIGTVVSPVRSENEFHDPNVVKAVLCDSRELAPFALKSVIYQTLYFSRSPIPYPRDTLQSSIRYRHVGIYAYEVRRIEEYIQLPPAKLEVAESLEQLRWLANYYEIMASVVDSSHTGIDTPEQYRAFVERYQAKESS